MAVWGRNISGFLITYQLDLGTFEGILVFIQYIVHDY
jgi:hypothetical protein